MRSSCFHTYLRTRVNILASRLFSEQDITQLLTLTLDEIGEKYALQSILHEATDPLQSSHILERAMLHLLMLEFLLLLRPIVHEPRDLLLYWSRKFELYNLKTLIRGKLNDLDIETIRDDLYDLPDKIRLPHEALLHAENVLEMLRLLERGPYASIARQARQVYEAQNEPFSLDAAIDRLYYSGMFAHTRNAAVTDRPGLHRLTRNMIDRQNILWLLRYRFAYHFAPSKAYYLLIPEGGQIGRKQLMQLANLESFDSLIDNLPAPYSNHLNGVNNSMQVRQRLDLMVSDVARRLIRTSPCAVVSALSYLVIREKDLRRLFAIVQGRILDLDMATIEEAVLGFASTPLLQETS